VALRGYLLAADSCGGSRATTNTELSANRSLVPLNPNVGNRRALRIVERDGPRQGGEEPIVLIGVVLPLAGNRWLRVCE
jgi:hypothetical protein